MIRIEIDYDLCLQISNIYLNIDYNGNEKIKQVKELTKNLYAYKDNIDYVIVPTCANNLNTYLNIYECHKINEIPYERTWCDYLTKCDRYCDEYVGSYECCECCPFHVGCEENIGKKFDPCDYDRYFEVITGIVKCKFNG